MRLALATLVALSTLAFGQTQPRRAPGFSLPDSKGVFQDPLDYRGKYLLVEFMQTDCPHCATFSKVLEQAKSKYGPRLAVISVATPPSNPKSIAKFIADNGVTSPIVLDCGQVALSYIRPKSPIGVPIPQLFVVDPQGNIVKSWAYSNETMAIFEGKALIPELGKIIKR